VTKIGGSEIQNGESWDTAFFAVQLQHAIDIAPLNYNGSPSLTNVIIRHNAPSSPDNPNFMGGGFTSFVGNQTMSNVTIRENEDGGLYVSTGSLTMYDSTITQNISYTSGAGISMNNSERVLSNVTISENEARGESGFGLGGGIYSTGSGAGSTLTLTDVSVTGNRANTSGGGLHTSYTVLTLTNVTIDGNTAKDGFAGGIFSANAKVTMTNAKIVGNSATEEGGGILLRYSGSAEPPEMTLTNVLISGNKAETGGGLYMHTVAPVLTNVTIAGNAATVEGGGMYVGFKSTPFVRNTIIWGNTAGSAPAVYKYPTASANADFSHSLIEGAYNGDVWNISLGTDGGNNIDADPQFVDFQLIASRPQMATIGLRMDRRQSTRGTTTYTRAGRRRICPRSRPNRRAIRANATTRSTWAPMK